MTLAAALFLAGLVFDANPSDGGETWQLASVEHEFGFRNDGDEPVRVVAVEPEDPAAEVAFDPEIVPPGGRGSVRVRQPVGLRLGVSRFRFGVRTARADEPGATEVRRLVLIAFAQSAYDVERPFLDFGLVDRAAGAVATFDVVSREVPTLALESVVAAPDFLQVRLEAVRQEPGAPLRLEFAIAPGAPRGFHVAAVHLRTNVPHQADYVVAVQTAVYDDVVPLEPGGVRLGAVPAGRPHVRVTRVGSRSGRTFGIETVEDPSGRLDAVATPCDDGGPDARNAVAGCWQIEIRLPALPEGPFAGTLLVRVAGDPQPVPLALAGLVVPADARVEDLGTLGPDSEIRKRRP